LLIATILGLAITYLVPPLVVFFGGWAAVWGGAAWAADERCILADATVLFALADVGRPCFL